MAERPILFSAPMVRALLAGTKTQTRRALRVQPPANTVQVSPFHHPDPRPMFYAWVRDGGAVADHPTAGAEISEWPPVPCPYGRPGDRLWVREAHSIGPGPGVPLEPGETAGALRWPHITYSADGAVERRDTRWKGAFGVCRPSIHMPRWASRILLEVTEVRVERLQAISEADARAEGFELGAPPCIDAPIRWYRHLWDQINGPGAWDANPFVWAVSFRVVKP